MLPVDKPTLIISDEQFNEMRSMKPGDKGVTVHVENIMLADRTKVCVVPRSRVAEKEPPILRVVVQASGSYFLSGDRWKGIVLLRAPRT
jgi:hypothetical protein